MTTDLQFRVYGLPAPQGSKKHVGNGRMVEMSKKVKPWRKDVLAAAKGAIAHETGFEPFDGPVGLGIVFYLPRPKSHFRTGRHADELKPGAPVYVVTNPDLDKMVRSTCDALEQAGVLSNDNRVARVRASKLYSETPGASIMLTSLPVTR